MMIKAILIDDEEDAIESLSWEIQTFCKEIEIVDTFTSPLEAISAINYLKPDCVFLDIEMPEMDGFKLLSQLIYRDFDLIITTAYDSYAIQAFKENAVDYLLKPIDSDDLQKVVKKVINNKGNNHLGKELKSALKNFLTVDHKKKVALPLNGKTVFVNLIDIIYCKSDGSYTTVYLTNNKKILISKRIKTIEELCSANFFLRVHQSYLVNLNFIKEYVKNDGYYLILDNNANIPVSKANRSLIHKSFESL